MPKLQPSVLTMNFDLPRSPSTAYIDLGQCASILNRRIYRQGMNYAVAGFRFGYSGSASPNIAVRSLPQTWVVGASWHKAFAKWKKQQDEALDNSSSIDTKARFNDFKVYADIGHKTLGVSGNLTPVTPGGFVSNTAYDLGEWNTSLVVIPNDGGTVGNTVEYALHMVGPDSASGTPSFSIINGYQRSRGVPFSPDPELPTGNPEVSFLSEMFNTGMDDLEVIVNATDRNNDLPYDQDEYPDGATNGGSTLPTHREISFTATTIGAHQNMEGGLFPCGLIQISHNATLAQDDYLTMQVMLMPGDYKGYLAEPMQEMN